MRNLLLLILIFLLAPCWPARTQPTRDTTAQRGASAPGFAAFAAQRSRLDRGGMGVLGSWALGNLLVSGLATGRTEGPAHYFHQMNLGWGAVNLALAGAGYLGARRDARPFAAGCADNVRAQLRTENLYLLNAGLDVAYLAASAYLLEKSRNPTAAGSPDRWRGYGQSLLLQGGFLLLFDGLQYGRHHRHGNRGLYPLLSRVNIGPGAFALALALPLVRKSHAAPSPAALAGLQP